MALLPPIIALLISLVILPGWSFAYDVTPKVAILCLGVCLPLAGARHGLSILTTHSRGRWLLRLLGVQALSLVLAVLVSSNLALSIGGSNWRRYGLATQIAVMLLALLSAASLARDPARIHTWLAIFCGGGCAAAAYGVLQFFGLDPLLSSAAYRVGEGEWAIVRPPGTFGHAGYAATFYLHAVFSGAALVAIHKQAWERWLGFATVVLGSIAILLSGTRGAMAGWVVGMAVLVYFLRPQPRRWHAVASAILLTAGIVFYLSLPGQALRARIRWAKEDAAGGARPMLWRDAAKMGAARWATGYGLEVFPSAFAAHQSEELARSFPDFYHESPHNMFLDAWTSQGALGMGVLLGFCILALSTARSSHAQSALCAGLAAAIVSQQFLSFTMPTALWFFLTAAILVGLENPRAAPRPLSHAPLVPICLMLGAYGVQLFVSDRLLRTTQVLLEAGDVTSAAAVYERARWWQPYGANADLWYSRAMLNATKVNRSAADVARGLQSAGHAATRAAGNSDDRQNAAYNLSAFCALRNDFPCVERSLRDAIAIAPNWYKPHWTLARALALAGRHAEAAAEAELAVRLDGGIHTEVQETLTAIRAKK